LTKKQNEDKQIEARLLAGKSDKFTAWFKKLKKKGPFYIFKSFKDAYAEMSYILIYNDAGSVKIAKFRDYSYGRWGPNVFGVLRSPSPTGLWSQRSGAVTEAMYQCMLDVWNETTTLKRFNVARVKFREM
jgi:hypothetical protein